MDRDEKVYKDLTEVYNSELRRGYFKVKPTVVEIHNKVKHSYTGIVKLDANNNIVRLFPNLESIGLEKKVLNKIHTICTKKLKDVVVDNHKWRYIKDL